VVVMVLRLAVTLLGVAYYVAIERKLIGMVQRRHGPNKRGVLGMVLPLADGIKLLTKELVLPRSAERSLFLSGPILLFILAYRAWLIYPVRTGFYGFKYGVLYYMCLVGVNVFGLIICGWSSGSRYGLLGGMRAVAQTVSYEVVFNTALFCPLLFFSELELTKIQEEVFFLFFLLPEVALVWAVSSLAELNRVPFDFVEGESELVSGYMVEHGGVGFVLLVLGEYARLIFRRVVTVCLFAKNWQGFVGDFLFVCLAVRVRLSLALIRARFPRYRYDKLIGFCWGSLLPLVRGIFLVCVSLVRKG